MVSRYTSRHVWLRAGIAGVLVLAVCTPAGAQMPLFAPAPGSPIAIEGAPGNILVNDVDQDDTPDLLVASGRGITILLGDGDGEFREAAGSPLELRDHPSETAVSDFNRDGKSDLAVASHDSYDVTILLGDGKGSFAPSPDSPVPMKDGNHPHTHGLHVGDLNGDDIPDLVTVNSDDNDVSLAFGNGRGGFTRVAAPVPVGASPYPGTLGDLNGDDHLDIVATSTDRSSATNEAATNALTVLYSDGQGGFRRASVPLRTVLPWFVVVTDVNADQHLDLLVTHAERNELTVLVGDGKGSFSETAHSPFDLGQSAWRMAAVDVNHDQRIDVIAAAGSGVCVLLGDGQGGLTSAPSSPIATAQGTWQLAVADLNGDGKPDIAASNLEQNSVTVLLAQ